MQEMRRLVFYLSVLMAAAALHSCSDGWSRVEREAAQLQSVLSTRSLTLLDSDGVPARSIGPGFTQYLLAVESQGEWNLESCGQFVHVARQTGYGPDTVRVLVGENWWKDRSCSLNFHDKESGSIQELVLVQAQSDNYPKTYGRLSALRGAGFSYIPNSNLSKGVDRQVFNLEELGNVQKETGIQLIADDFYPQSRITSITSDSLEGIEQQINVEVSLEVMVYGLKIGVSGKFDSSSQSSDSCEYGYMNLLSSYFTREIQYRNVMALASSDPVLYKRLFAPGFRSEIDELVRDLNMSASEDYRMERCESFLKRFGAGVIQKAVLGCSMEYLMSIRSSLLTNDITIGGTLTASFGDVFDVAKISGGGEFSEKEKAVARNAKVNINARGGDTGFVGITAAGGRVDYDMVQKWQMSVTPENAALIDIKVIPFHYIIPDPGASEIMERYYRKFLSSTDR